MKIKSVSLSVHGKVQGVFFRQSTKDKAQELGLKGFVKNEADGSVYIEAEGTEEAVGALRAWCETGPRRAEVSRVEMKDKDPAGYTDFRIGR
jgi:acylphosphatase